MDHVTTIVIPMFEFPGFSAVMMLNPEQHPAPSFLSIGYDRVGIDRYK